MNQRPIPRKRHTNDPKIAPGHARTRLSPQPSVLALSTCPAGESFPLPQPADYDQEFRRLNALVSEQRLMGREIVVVMGVGFVGAVMAGVVADSVDRKSGNPTKFVIGMQRPSPRSLKKQRSED